VDFWQERVAGFDVSAAGTIASSTGHPVDAVAAALLSAGVRILDGDIAIGGATLQGEGEATVSRPGRMDGLLGWFVAELAPGVTVTNAPGADGRIDRRQLFLPTAPVDVTPGDRVWSRLVAAPRSDVLTWSVEVRAATGGLHASSHQTVDALPLSAADLQRTAPGARPVLSRRGRAAAAVLRRSDGHHTVAEIECELALRFPDLFADRRDAGPFVASLLARHGR
jgi:hypothetical protein